MPMYNLIEYSDNYSKISGSLWQCYRDKPTLTHAGSIEDFTGANGSSKSFKFKEQITDQTGDNGRNIVKIMMSLKYI